MSHGPGRPNPVNPWLLDQVAEHQWPRAPLPVVSARVNSMERRGTATSNFGVGKRESHDASAFYQRFSAPEISTDDTVRPPRPIPEPFQIGDARSMTTLLDGEVALVVTSPPYFAGKQYEEELEADGIPASYAEFLEMLRGVFSECKRVLEPGGRIAVNVANLGRKPYRSLGADVVDILQSLGLLLRGEVVWRKGEGASGSCAWGSYRSPANPVLRDVTERVIIASKGRFDRAKSAKDRAARDLPHRSTLTADEFMTATLDVWDFPAESAKRVKHPAPFPVALPERLIHLYTYEDDLVLDPFMGSGTTLVAASRTNRRYVGFDLDPVYAEISSERVRLEGAPVQWPFDSASADRTVDERSLQLAREGKTPEALARVVLEEAGFTITETGRRLPKTGVTIAYVARDRHDRTWYFDVVGSFTTSRSGLHRTEQAWKSVGVATVAAKHGATPFVVLAAAVPAPATESDNALRAAGPSVIFDVVDLLDADAFARLSSYASTDNKPTSAQGFWRPRDLSS